MAVGDRQKEITALVSDVLGEPAQTNVSFDWFVNKHSAENFKGMFPVVDALFKKLNGDSTSNQAKRTVKLKGDAYFGGKYNFFFEFDEFQHFSSFRKITLSAYPQNVPLNFSVPEWISLCDSIGGKADNYRQSKKTKEFDFAGGRTAQRAFLDCFRDLLPAIHGLSPTLRINEFEVVGINHTNANARLKIEKLLKSKML